MSIVDTHPTIIDFTDNEISTLEYITNRGLLNKAFPGFASYIQQLYYTYKNRRGKSCNFDFHTDFFIEIEGEDHKIYIGAKVTGKYDPCSYFLAMAGKDPEGHQIIRKFHFDFAIPDISTKNPVPIYHLQYGGKLSPEMVKDGMSSDKLDTWLSIPRLSFSPMNLAILLDITFCELGSTYALDLVENSEWRSLIYKNEVFLTNHYFTGIKSHIDSQNYNKDRLIRDYCYGR